MILGVYWYYRFPEGLYHFRFFRFLKGLGGHISNPAKLQARVYVNYTENCLTKIKELKSVYGKADLTVKKNGNELLIETGDYTLFDYHFQMVSEIDEVLKNENAVLTDHEIPFGTEITYNFDTNLKAIPREKKHDFIRLVGSVFKSFNAENFSLRIDCHVSLRLKNDFLDDLATACGPENISVFYHYHFVSDDFVNLMLFFTNGRQMRDHIQVVDISSFGNRVQGIAGTYSVQFGHKNGLESYPVNGPHIHLMTDEEFII